MLNRWFGVHFHHYLHLLGMMVLAFGLPLNKVLMSIGAIWGVSNLLLEGDFSSYWQRMKQNTTYLFLLSFFLLHIVGLFWSNNLEFGFHDLRVKLPLFAVPLALVAHPIVDKKEIHLILVTFLVSLLICSGINFNFYLQNISNNISGKFREMSLFGSHIRFGILIAIGFFVSLYLAWQHRKLSLIFLGLSIWFLLYTYFSQVFSGVISLVAGLLFAGIYFLWQYKWLRLTIFSIGIVCFTFCFFFLQSLKHKKNLDGYKIEHWTAHGHYYYNNLKDPLFEQGKPIYIHISEEELNVEWPKYSKISLYGMSKTGQPIRGILYRYMTALNLKKDAEGLKGLSKQDIQNIENGIFHPENPKSGLMARYRSLLYQIENASNPNGQSFLQRIEYWKTASQIIQKNPIFGVGTGDVQDAFDKQYVLSNTQLLPEFRFRAHNMFLTVQLTFGIFGSFLFFGFLYSFLKTNFLAKNVLAFCIFGAIFASFFIEDTLETQTGVSLFALFLGIFLVPRTE